MNSTADTLRAAKALIENPEHWTTGAMARPYGSAFIEVKPDDPEAIAWCAIGALKKVDGPYENDAISTLAQAVVLLDSRLVVGNMLNYPINFRINAVTAFNDWRDSTQHSNVMKAFDKAIELAEARK